MELVLVQAGYSLAEIRGEREVHTVEQKPTGLWAAVGRVSPRSVRVVAALVLAGGLLLAYQTGLVGAVVLSLAVGLALHLLGEMDAEVQEVQHEVERPGMSHQEVLDRLVQYDEMEEIREEKANEQQPSTPQTPSSRRY